MGVASETPRKKKEKTMTTYRIESAMGVMMGTYEACSLEDALITMAKDAGYRGAEVNLHAAVFHGYVREMSGKKVGKGWHVKDGRIVQYLAEPDEEEEESDDSEEDSEEVEAC